MLEGLVWAYGTRVGCWQGERLVVLSFEVSPIVHVLARKRSLCKIDTLFFVDFGPCVFLADGGSKSVFG